MQIFLNFLFIITYWQGKNKKGIMLLMPFPILINYVSID
jgi:hypothetical protein